MTVIIKGKPTPPQAPKKDECTYARYPGIVFPEGQESAVRADLYDMHKGKVSADVLRNRHGVTDLSALHGWAHRPEVMKAQGNSDA